MDSIPIHTQILMIIGKIVLALFYGTLGTFSTVLLLIYNGPSKFFRRVQRATPPAQAMDPVYGKHDMIKLKASCFSSINMTHKSTSDQPLMLFVHGFPECWYTWRYQMKYFSKNYRVVAFDLRGYGLSSKPANVKDYRIDLLAGDIADLVEGLGYKSCILVAHDWGALIAWVVPMLYPNLIDKLIILNAPHPGAYRDSLSVKQLRKSWYMFFYQVPFMPELLFQSNDLALFKQIFCTKPMGLINTNNMTSDDLEVFKYTFSQKGTPTAAINYYRAFFRHPRDDLEKKINVPVLIIWGCKDGALGEELADASKIYCSDVCLKKIQNASHWVQQDAPDEVNRYIEAYLNEKSALKRTTNE
ncbi:unnamed protein product [Adineta steineri]|uniref:AB hydrolase-1 domain-containing protein n=2 Tax=Adineta steineri TaxID=433720 RepID=A0A815NYP1_9BILA|nr:unnamed protein product [Adineta steineri]